MAVRTKRAPKTNMAFLKGKTVLITGGTGTFGHACIKRLLKEPVGKIIVFSRDELKQSQLKHQYPDEKRLRFFLGDIRDKDRLDRAFHTVNIVVHAAALKQVPATEYNPTEAIKTNIIGTQNVIDAAIDAGVEKVLLVSSDKAVQPINLYGATKLAAEKLSVAANAYSGGGVTAISVIRYGNVIGSRGSFIELLRAQRASGVITLTHEKMTRFWITIEHVMDIVLQSLEAMKGGEIFVPKMKNMPVADVIKLLTPECKIRTIGIRPGEKLHEVLITEYEAPRTKDVGFAYAIKPEFTFGSNRTAWLDKKPAAEKDFFYASDNPMYRLSPEEAAKIITL